MEELGDAPDQHLNWTLDLDSQDGCKKGAF
jgi:hypothetical protein